MSSLFLFFNLPKLCFKKPVSQKNCKMWNFLFFHVHFRRVFQQYWVKLAQNCWEIHFCTIFYLFNAIQRYSNVLIEHEIQITKAIYWEIIFFSVYSIQISLLKCCYFRSFFVHYNLSEIRKTFFKSSSIYACHITVLRNRHYYLPKHFWIWQL